MSNTQERQQQLGEQELTPFEQMWRDGSAYFPVLEVQPVTPEWVQTEILDMAWLVKRDHYFAETFEEVHKQLVPLRSSTSVAQALEALDCGMLWNIPVPHYDFDTYAQALTSGELPEEVAERARTAALTYAAFLLTMKHRSIIDRAFFDSVRGTVHPKKAAQLPLHLVNRNSLTFPYNGVPVVFAKNGVVPADLHKAVRTMRFSDVLSYHNASAVYEEGADEPFYYLIQ